MKLIIDAKNGTDYVATAWLIDSAGRIEATGEAVMRARDGFDPVEAGIYAKAQVQAFPSSEVGAVEWGSHAVTFFGAGDGKVLVHGGRMADGNGLRPVYGSIRLSKSVYDKLLWRLSTAAGASMQLEVRIGKKPSAWKFWDSTRPTPRDKVTVSDDDGIDVFDVMYPELAPYRHPNSAMAWMLYFQHERREDQERQRAASHTADAGAGDGPAADCSEAETCLSDIQQPGGRTKSNGDGVQAGSAVAGLAPLFVVDAPEGADKWGRISNGDLPVCKGDDAVGVTESQLSTHWAAGDGGSGASPAVEMSTNY